MRNKVGKLLLVIGTLVTLIGFGNYAFEVSDGKVDVPFSAGSKVDVPFSVNPKV